MPATSFNIRLDRDTLCRLALISVSNTIAQTIDSHASTRNIFPAIVPAKIVSDRVANKVGATKYPTVHKLPTQSAATNPDSFSTGIID